MRFAFVQVITAVCEDWISHSDQELCAFFSTIIPVLRLVTPPWLAFVGIVFRPWGVCATCTYPDTREGDPASRVPHVKDRAPEHHLSEPERIQQVAESPDDELCDGDCKDPGLAKKFGCADR